MLPTVEVNYWSVLGAALAVNVLGAIYYNPKVLGKMWMDLQGVKQADIDKAMPAASMAGMFIASLVVAYILKHFLVYLNVQTINDGLVAASWIFIGFFLAGGASNYLFPAKPAKLFVINNIYHLASLLIMAAILVKW